MISHNNMRDAIQFILLVGGYILVTYFILKFISKWTVHSNPYLRLLILSFIYALFCGLGIAGTGGDPGFGLPVPNILAIALMFSNGFYRGVRVALYILGFWWALIFVVMLIRHIINKRHKPYKTGD